MLRFQHISYLFALGLIPILVVLFIWMVNWRKDKLRRLGDERLIKSQLVGFIPGRATLKFLLATLALACVIVGAANLQMSTGRDEVQRKGIDVVIALDVSKSMLAKDIQPDRLTRAKQLVQRMMDKMKNNRVALVVFAGRAYLQVPLTVDYGAMKMMLQNVTPDAVPTQGTVISDAIELAKNSFSEKERKYKALVLISDGEDHDDHAVEKVKEALETGVVIHTIGIGSPQGTTLYDPETRAVKLDDQGNPVISKLNEQELKTIAAEGKGTYTLLRNTDDAADRLVDEINGMEQKNLGASMFTEYDSYFQWFLGLAVLLLAIDWMLPGSGLKVKTKTT